jgi:hypothetical protein
MLSDQEKASLEAMSAEDLMKLLGLIREAKTLYGHRDGMSMPPSAVAKMTEVVGTELLHVAVGGALVVGLGSHDNLLVGCRG